MKINNRFVVISLVFLLVITSFSSITYAYRINVESRETQENISTKTTENEDDYYFIQITDTHVMHKIFDLSLEYKNHLINLISHINSFENKPRFVVITGDLVSIGGGLIGAFNYRAFLDCLYKEDGQLYTDSSCEISVYTIPGNHDYLFHLNLFNYHKFIDNRHTIIQNPKELLENRQLSDRFTLTFGNLTLFCLNSGHGYFMNPLREMIHFKGSGLNYWFDIEWFESVLVNCTTKHKIVLMHHPAVNWGEYDIIGRNKDIFIQLCEGYDVDLVLAGHTHASRVFDKDKNFYKNEMLPLNCSNYPPLYVQTDACKEGGFYRNITISADHIMLDKCVNYNK
jgi:3',5'-cyclic AMP phosphodiesterase CpdA